MARLPIDSTGDGTPVITAALFALSGAPREAFERFGHPRATPIFAPTFRGEGVVRLDDVTRDPRLARRAEQFIKLTGSDDAATRQGDIRRA